MVFFKRIFLAAILALWGVSAMAAGKVRIIVSVDWEGRNLEQQNLDKMKKFRADFPEIPLQHFLNAAYYTKPDANPRLVTRQIKSVLRAGDEHGLHIHGWRSLFEASGVEFLTWPTFYEPVDFTDCDPDCGHEVAIFQYSEDDLMKVIDFSVNTLQQNGFNKPTSFRAGGWVAKDNVLNALARSGFTLDSSATDPAYLEASWGQDNLYRFVKEIWQGTTETTQPYVYKTKARRTITELPNNGSLADYVTGERMLQAFKANANLLSPSKNNDVYLSIGFHQETAVDFLPELARGINLIKQYAKKEKIPYEFVVPHN